VRSALEGWRPCCFSQGDRDLGKAEVTTHHPVRSARQVLLFAIAVVIHDLLMFGFPKLISVQRLHRPEFLPLALSSSKVPQSVFKAHEVIMRTILATACWQIV